jgi:hypothetical protein
MEARTEAKAELLESFSAPCDDGDERLRSTAPIDRRILIRR